MQIVFFLSDEPLVEDPSSVKSDEGSFGAFRDESKHFIFHI